MIKLRRQNSGFDSSRFVLFRFVYFADFSLFEKLLTNRFEAILKVSVSHNIWQCKRLSQEVARVLLQISFIKICLQQHYARFLHKNEFSFCSIVFERHSSVSGDLTAIRETSFKYYRVHHDE